MVAPRVKGAALANVSKVRMKTEKAKADAERSKANALADSVQVREFGGFVEGGYPFNVYMPP